MLSAPVVLSHPRSLYFSLEWDNNLNERILEPLQQTENHFNNSSSNRSSETDDISGLNAVQDSPW
jgi:hypothetical protein